MKKPPPLSGSIKVTTPHAAAHGVTFAQMAHVCGADNMRLIVAIAQRCAQLVAYHRQTALDASDAVLEPNPEIVQADLMVTHYHRRLDLRALLTCNDLDLIVEIATINQNIKRPLVFFPHDVKLRFAQSGATYYSN